MRGTVIHHCSFKLIETGMVVSTGTKVASLLMRSGGNSLKLSFQIVNSQSPNSPSNTCVFSIFEAGDSVTNLKVVGDRFGNEIGSLENHTWK